MAAEADTSPPVSLTGSERARELNRALKRALCSGVSTREREAAKAREDKYEDQAAKRRRLHPVEWRPEDTSLEAVQGSASRLKGGCVALEVVTENVPPRRFTELKAVNDN